MKITMVSLYPNKTEKHVNMSGVASYTKNLAKGIPLSPDDEIYVICNKLNGPEEYKEDGITVVRTFDRNYKFVRQIYQEIKRLRPDVIHVQQEIPLYGGIYTAFMLPFLLFLLRKYHTIVTLHHVVSLQKIDKKFVASNKSSAPVWLVSLAFLIITKSLVRWAHTTIVHEDYFRNILINEYGIKSRTIKVVPHGVENFTPQRRDVARKNVGLGATQHAVLFMGYLAGYKGVDLLLDGFAEYAKADPAAVLIIGAGKHPKFAADPAYLQTYQTAQKKAAHLIPPSQYKWVGFIAENEIANYYSAADVSIFPYTISMSSSGPMSFAMGYEQPFLASDAFADVLPRELLFSQTPQDVAAKLRYFFTHTHDFVTLSAAFKAKRLWQEVGSTTKILYERLYHGTPH